MLARVVERQNKLEPASQESFTRSPRFSPKTRENVSGRSLYPHLVNCRDSDTGNCRKLAKIIVLKIFYIALLYIITI